MLVTDQPKDLSMTTVITTVCTTVHGGGRRITWRILWSPYTAWALGINLGHHNWWQALLSAEPFWDCHLVFETESLTRQARMACQCNPPVSPSSEILSWPCTSIPSVLCGFWGLSSGLLACMAITLRNELLFLPPNFLYNCFMKPSCTNWGKWWSFSIFLLCHIFLSFSFPTAPPTHCHLLPTLAGFLPFFLTLYFPLFSYLIVSSTWTISSLLPTSWTPFPVS